MPYSDELIAYLSGVHDISTNPSEPDRQAITPMGEGSGGNSLVSYLSGVDVGTEEGPAITPRPETTMGGLLSAGGRGFAEGVTTEIPSMVGGAIQFTGSNISKVAPSVGEPFEWLGELVKDWAEETSKNLYGEAPEDLSEAERIVYEGSKMLGPSLIPTGAVIGGARALLGIGKLVKAAKMTKNAVEAASLMKKAASLAKTANKIGSISTAGLFGLSQAQQSVDTGMERAEMLEARGDLEGAQKAREAAQGIGPYLSGGIEAVGEYFGTKYLGKLLGLSEAEILKRGASRVVKDFLRTLGVEIGTEIGQAGGQAFVEKATGIRPEADPIAEALDVIGPTAFMTILTGGLGGGASILPGAERTPEQPSPRGLTDDQKESIVTQAQARLRDPNDPFSPDDANSLIKKIEDMGEPDLAERLKGFVGEFQRIRERDLLKSRKGEEPGPVVYPKGDEILDLDNLVQAPLPALMPRERERAQQVRRIYPPEGQMIGDTWTEGTGEIQTPYPGQEKLAGPILRLRAPTDEPGPPIEMRQGIESDVYFPEGYTQAGETVRPQGPITTREERQLQEIVERLDRERRERGEREEGPYNAIPPEIETITPDEGEAEPPPTPLADLPEHITETAILMKDGTTYTGKMHHEAYDKIPVEEQENIEDDEGFLTSKGRYLSRLEANHLARDWKGDVLDVEEIDATELIGMEVAPEKEEAPTVEGEPAKGKEPWEMTKDEYFSTKPIVALRGPNGEIYKGKPREVHFQLYERLPEEVQKSLKSKDSGWWHDGEYYERYQDVPGFENKTPPEANERNLKTQLEHRSAIMAQAKKDASLVPEAVQAEYPEIFKPPTPQAEEGAREGEETPTNDGKTPKWKVLPSSTPDETISDRLAGKKSATVGILIDTEDNSELKISLKPDTSSPGEYSVVLSDGKRSNSIRMMYKGGSKIADSLGHFENYMNTDNVGRFVVKLDETPKIEQKPPTLKGKTIKRKAVNKAGKPLKERTDQDAAEAIKDIDEQISAYEAFIECL